MASLETDDYKSLLDKFNKLSSENEEKKNLGIHDYSLINALLKKNREVELHSNFIYSMINPNSSHYCGNIFLELFLKSINEANFLNLDNAKVHKEKGKIDLLIEDGEKIIIIENKLNAPDQKHQISRYISYAIETYVNNDKNNFNDKIRVVYLSQYKDIPSKGKNSCIGFEKLNGKSKQLIWDNKEVTFCNSDKFNLPDGTKLKFNRVQHSQHLLKWVNLAKKWLKVHKPNNASRSLDYAFDEYELILKRLDTKKQWRNLMTLDKYTLKLQEKEQRKMYKFMCESKQSINSYLGKKLFETIEETFNYNETSKSLDEKRKIDVKTCIKWFNKKGNDYKNIGFEFEKNEKKYIFELATNYIYFGTGNRYEAGNRQGRVSDDIFVIIDKIKKSYAEIQ